MATLKISDLSVGDWVEISHEDYGWNPAQINVCGDLGIGVYFKDIDPEEEYDCTLSQARPIPIMPEILEENGIHKTYECDEYAVYQGEGFSITKYYTCLWEFEFRRNRVTIQMVHDLQHALRLAGVDKEINL